MGEPSIHDVARAAGVHSSTVSRAFSRPDAVNSETRAHILQIAEDLGYRVNPVGRALRNRTSRLVPLVVPDITNPFYGELAKAVSTAAGVRGYQVVLCVTEGIAGRLAGYLESMDALFSPFAVVAPSTRLDTAALGKTSLAKRMIVIDRVPPELDVPTVSIDNEAGVRLAFEHLWELGHRRIAYLTGTVGTFSALERVRAYHRLASEYPLAGIVISGGYSAAASRSAADHFMSLQPRPTAVIASNDMAAFGFISAAVESGLRVPDDLSVMGFDGVAIGETFSPPISTVAQPLAELGETAIDLAERFARTGVREHVVLTPWVIRRRSTRPLD